MERSYCDTGTSELPTMTRSSANLDRTTPWKAVTTKEIFTNTKKSLLDTDQVFVQLATEQQNMSPKRYAKTKGDENENERSDPHPCSSDSTATYTSRLSYRAASSIYATWIPLHYGSWDILRFGADFSSCTAWSCSLELDIDTLKRASRRQLETLNQHAPSGAHLCHVSERTRFFTKPIELYSYPRTT